MRNIYVIIIVCVVALCMGIGIQYAQEFRFYALEENHLFLYDRADIMHKLLQPGGLSLLIASFVTQFWQIPLVGVLTLVICNLLVSGITFLILRKNKPGFAMVGMSLLPIVFLFLCMENDYYRFQGHIAYLLFVLHLWGYVSLPIKRWTIRLCIGICMVLSLYGLAGSVAVAFAVSACLEELLNGGYRGGWGMMYIAVAVLVGYSFVRFSWIQDMESAFTPYFYYDWPSTYFFPMYAWLMLPLLQIAAFAISKISSQKLSPLLVVVLGIAISFYFSVDLFKKVHSPRNYRFLQEQYWTDNGAWDQIVASADRRTPVYFLSYLNLALAEQGNLMNGLKYYNQQSPSDLLMYADPNLKHGKALLSRIYFSWGYISEARQAAFDANLLTPGSCNPRELKIMIQTNLVLGAYEVAEKYITLMEKTLYYSEWATSMRKFLHNEKAVSEDPVLGLLHASIPKNNHYIRYESLQKDMEDIMTANPSQKIIPQFYEAYSLLLKENKR